MGLRVIGIEPQSQPVVRLGLVELAQFGKCKAQSNLRGPARRNQGNSRPWRSDKPREALNTEGRDGLRNSAGLCGLGVSALRIPPRDPAAHSPVLRPFGADRAALVKIDPLAFFSSLACNRMLITFRTLLLDGIQASGVKQAGNWVALPGYLLFPDPEAESQYIYREI